MGGPSWGYLDHIEGFWLDTWRTRSSLMLWSYLNIRKIPCNFCEDICMRSVSGMGVLGEFWGFLIEDLEDCNHWCPEWSCFTQWKINWKVCVDTCLGSVSRMGGHPPSTLGGHQEFLKINFRDGFMTPYQRSFKKHPNVLSGENFSQFHQKTSKY